jgi:glycosyltransferase involved in cell wall biosynthesis
MPSNFGKRIVIVTPWFGAFAGGAEALARSTARELVRRGVPVTIMTTCCRSPYDNWWEDHHSPGLSNSERTEVQRFPTDKDSAPYHAVVEKIRRGTELNRDDQQAFFDYGINSRELVLALREFANDDRCEILALPYFHGLTHAVARACPEKVSLIPCFHNEPQFYWPITAELLSNAKHIFYNSAEEKEMSIRQYGRAVGRKVVEGTLAGVAVELAHCNDEVESQALSLPGDYFVYVGRKEQGKNVPLLCEWFAAYVESSDHNCKLVFVGGGESDLVPRSSRFVDLGFLSEAAKQEVIKRSRGIINLSENESFSIVLMEAWLLGVPAVVHGGCAVMRRHVRRANGGLYVYDLEEFSAALDYLINNPDVAQQLAENGKNYASRNFSFDKVLARYLRTFSSATPGVPGRAHVLTEQKSSQRPDEYTH